MPAALQDNWKEFIVRYKNLPADAQSIFFNEDIEQALRSIAVEARLPAAGTGVLADHVSHLLLGVLTPAEFAPRLARELGTDAARTESICRAVNEQVLSRARGTLQQQYGTDYESVILSGVTGAQAAPADLPRRRETLKPIAPPPVPPPISYPIPPAIIPKPAPLPPPPPPVPPPPPQPQPVVHQTPPPPASRPAPPPPPSVTILEPHPVAPPFPSKPPAAPPPPAAPSPAVPPPAPQFRPVVIPEPQLPPTPPPTEPTTPTADAADIIQKHYGTLPPAVRDAVRNIPIDQILRNIGKEQQLTVEQMGKMAEGVMRFIAGKASQEEFLDTLLEDIFGGFRQKSAVVSQEINAKIFSPIRKSLRVTTAEPTPAPKPPSTDSTGSPQASSGQAPLLPRPETPLASLSPKPTGASSAPAPSTPPKPIPAPATPPSTSSGQAAPPPQKTPSEPEPWIIYPLRSLHPSPMSQDKNLAWPAPSVPRELPDRPGWGDAYPPLDREVIPPIRPEILGQIRDRGEERGMEPPPNLPTAPAQSASDETPKPIESSPAVAKAPAAPAAVQAPIPPPPPASEPAPPAARTIKTDPLPPARNPSHDPYREAPDE